jgi:hypothetical protein
VIGRMGKSPVLRTEFLHGYKPKGEDTWGNGFNFVALIFFKNKTYLIVTFKPWSREGPKRPISIF